MKRQYIYMFLFCLSAIISCEQIDELELDGNQVQIEKVNLTIDAVVERPADTRTALEGSLKDEVMRTVWVPDDAIGMVAWRSNANYYQPVEEFKTNITENSEEAVFEGAIASSSKYYALYPYSSSLRCKSDKFVFELPQTQNYVADSFDPKATPMVAKAAQGEDFEFKNLCGLLALKMTGKEAVKAITFIGKDENGNYMPLSGTAFVDMGYEDAPVITFNAEDVGLGVAELGSIPVPNTSVTLNCETPVQLGETSIPFYFVLPPATYSSFIIMVHTTDGEVMVKVATKPITISRSHVKPTAALQYAESVYINLSEMGCANSYIVSEAGMYSFDANIIGNGEFGLVEGTDFHTTDVEIKPSKVEIIWQDRENVITAPTLVDGQVRFYAMGNEGNALIAVKDEADKILWSWHIWVTDKPMEQTYVNDKGTYVMLDRNIGAIRADRGTSEDDWKETIGLHYQWGRKEPFTNKKYTNLGAQMYIDETIENPTCFVSVGGSWTKEWSKHLWSTDQKTIYDPCPVGYRVAVPEAWYGFTKTGETADRPQKMNIAGAFDHGWYFYINADSETAWYPATSDISFGNFYDSSTTGRIWSAYNNGGVNSRYLYYYYNSDMDCNLNPYNADSYASYARSVRCMKDENATSMSVKIQSVSEVTATSANVTATVASQGNITIERAGIVCCTYSSVTLDNGEAFDANVTSGEFTVTVENLESLKKYYVKSFAVASDGNTYYSDKTLSFMTPNEDGIINLSAGGTANCYIVYPVKGTYAFDLVKGNSSESVGEVSSMEVLWETYNNASPVTAGSVVSSVTLENGKAKFEVPENAVSGNALIAAKDANGTILWSWHIWMTEDHPAEQTYVNTLGTFIVQDRNLGATRADRGTGDEWKESCGLDYQWGRKDPFAGGFVQETNQYYSIEDFIRNPTVRSSSWDRDESMWNTDKKTIYDPCPVGYRVASNDIWSNFSTSNTSGSFENGWYFYINEKSETAWYPNRARANSNRTDYWGDAYMMSSTYNGGIYYSSSSVRNKNNIEGNLRCMKYERATSVSANIYFVSDITATSAKVTATVISQGDITIERAGIVCGTSSSVTLDNGKVIDANVTSGEFTVTLENLESLKKYYVKSFAVASDGNTYYSHKTISFMPHNEDGITDLGVNGTANCYIVYPVKGTYAFDLVKGNSFESVGAVSSVEVLWETYNNASVVKAGSVVSSVTLKGDQAQFEIPENVVPGNALIAAKDANGTILWSWHIWVADYDPVQTQQTYISGAVMMDRNLGALRSTPGDSSVNGMFYQWGRKDPLLGTYDAETFITTYPANIKQYTNSGAAKNVDYTIKNPTTVVANLTNPDGSWATTKTIYDPCPAGWRVPDGGPGVWDGIDAHTTVTSGYYLEPPYSEPRAYYPGAGYTEGTSTLYWYSAVYSRSCTPIGSDSYALCMFGTGTHQISRTIGRASENTVRCMKD